MHPGRVSIYLPILVALTLKSLTFCRCSLDDSLQSNTLSAVTGLTTISPNDEFNSSVTGEGDANSSITEAEASSTTLSTYTANSLWSLATSSASNEDLPNKNERIVIAIYESSNKSFNEMAFTSDLQNFWIEVCTLRSPAYCEKATLLEDNKYASNSTVSIRIVINNIKTDSQNNSIILIDFSVKSSDGIYMSGDHMERILNENSEAFRVVTGYSFKIVKDNGDSGEDKSIKKPVREVIVLFSILGIFFFTVIIVTLIVLVNKGRQFCVQIPIEPIEVDSQKSTAAGVDNQAFGVES